MLMKKILSLTIALLMLLSFVSCSGGNEATDETTESAAAPVVSLVAEKTEVLPGEEIKVTVNVTDALLTACFDIFVYADDGLEVVAVETCPSELILAANNREEAGEEYVIVRGMSAATYDVADEDMCVITYKVKDDVAAGTKISLTLQAPTYQLGFDESGDDIYNVDCNLQGLVLEVK